MPIFVAFRLRRHCTIPRHVQWLVLTTSARSARQSLDWAEDFPRLSCNAAFAVWPSLAPCDVPWDPYGAVCEGRDSLLAMDECASRIHRWPSPQRTLRNASVRYDCALAGAEQRCEMPTAQALLEAMRFFGVRMRRVHPGRITNVGLPDARGLFSGTLGHLQRRHFDLHLSDVALELERFHALLFMEAAYVTSLDFVYAVPAAAAAPGLEELAAVLPVRLWLLAAAAALAVAAAAVLLRPAAVSTAYAVQQTICAAYAFIIASLTTSRKTGTLRVRTSVLTNDDGTLQYVYAPLIALQCLTF
ncbi:uncharacterized protein LOC144129456 [Amblyomma americanum]